MRKASEESFFLAGLRSLISTEERGTIVRLAQHVGVSAQHMGNIIHGRTPLLSRYQAKIASFFQLPIEEMEERGKSAFEKEPSIISKFKSPFRSGIRIETSTKPDPAITAMDINELKRAHLETQRLCILILDELKGLSARLERLEGMERQEASQRTSTGSSEG